MRRLIVGATLTLALASPAAAATIPVGSLSGAFSTLGPGVALTLDGVQFGPYVDGGAAGGSVVYSGFNGQKLSQIRSLAYTAMYATTDAGGNPVAAPYLRVFLEGPHDVIFSPNTQPAPQKISQSVFHDYNVVGGTVRYDDDSGNGPDSPWAAIVAAHGNEVVSGIRVSVGNSAGAYLSALLRRLTVNDDAFCFNCATPGTPGTPGAAGTPGATASADFSSSRAPLKIRSIRLDRKNGTVKVVLYCPTDAGLCEGKVTIRADKQNVAAKTFNQRGGAKFSLTVKLSSSARKKVSRASKVEGIAFSRDQVGAATRLTRTLKK